MVPHTMTSDGRAPLRISVVIPTYNRARWIEAALRTVRAQDYPVLEVIFVDDGSTDDSARILAGLDASVRVIHQRNAGVSTARNHGVEVATGDWVAFLDSDDTWHPSKLSRQVAALTAVLGAVWCTTSGDAVDEDDRTIPGRAGLAGVFPLFRELAETPEAFLRRFMTPVVVPPGAPSVTALAGDAFESLFTLNYVHASGLLVQREAFRASGGFDPALQVAEDTEFFHRFAASHPLVFVTDALFGYRVMHGASLSNSASVIPRITTALASIDGALAARQAPSAAEREAWRAARIRLLRRLAYTHVTEFAPREAREALRSARAAGAPLDATALGLLAASLLPVPVLRGLHALKRAVRRS